jgi:hypothetical protein
VADGRVKMTDGEATWEKGEEGIEVQKEWRGERKGIREKYKRNIISWIPIDIFHLY